MRVKANRGSAGIDNESIEDFEEDLKNNLYKIWNRLSSGTYFPPPVKTVEIPKSSGGKRKLGIPTVSDRVAQMVAKMFLEPKLEPIFHDSSYGYRPKKSAIQAVGQARKMCLKYSWVVEFDIKGLFDNIDHELLMKAVKHHTSEKWVILNIERWLKAPFQNKDGEITKRESGTPQGGVISPLLANLFLHYAFDEWMSREFEPLPFERYADDGIIHCRTLKEAKYVMACLESRLKKCKLEIHHEKSKIVYCKDVRRKEEYPNVKFTFLGYEFCSRPCRSKSGELFIGFVPAASPKGKKALMEKIRGMHLSLRSENSLEQMKKILDPIMRGWINYFGVYYKSSIRQTIMYVNQILMKWAMRKFKRFGRSYGKVRRWMRGIYKKNPNLFAHWSIGLQI